MSENKLKGVTRRSFMGGVGAAAITGAGAMMAFSVKEAMATPAPMKWDKKADVVVIGSGLAGLCAAVEAAESGAKVVLLEAFAVTGGNSSLSTAWFNAANSPIQRKLGIKDSVQSFYEDSMAISDNKRDPAITKVMAEKSSKTIQWLMDHKIKFLEIAEPAMGSPKPRAIQAEGYGAAVTKILASLCKQKGVETIMKARALNLYSTINKGTERIAGVKAEIKGKNTDISAKAVVIASGGFMNNKKLVARFMPEWQKTLTIGTPTNVGDGLIMSNVEGADAINLNRALVTPTLEVKTKSYLTSGALSGGAILVNEKGERFTDELKGYTEVSLSVLDQKKTYEVMVEACHPKVTSFIKKGIVKRADTIDELAKKMNTDKAKLQKAIQDFNQATAGKIKDVLGRTTFRETLAPPFYFMQILPVLLLTLGGLKVNTNAQVLNIKDELALPGLYAAGEVAGGYIEYGYRTGDSLMYCSVFGLIAGKNAAAEKL